MLEILDAASPAGRAAWLTAWKAWPGREVFAHPDYVSLYADAKARACCAAWDSDAGRVLYPFLLRDIRQEVYCRSGPQPLTDIITPYGYGGPFAWNVSDRGVLSGAFWEAFDAALTPHNVVSEVVRFHLSADALLPYPGDREEVLRNVVVDLEPDEEVLWRGFRHKVRKNVNKARQSGVTILQDSDGAQYDAFKRIYAGTMDRREAASRYYFGDAYFDAIRNRLAGHFRYFHAAHQGEIVSTELVLVSAEAVYSFLGGTDAAAFALRPNDLLKYEIIRWARSQGKKRFVLGGGAGADDGIYQYKLSFAPEGSLPFFVGSRIVRPDLYAALLDDKAHYARANGLQWNPVAGRVPEYRT